MTRAQTARLTEGLKTLRMATIRKSYREQAELARKETLSYEAYLLELVERECETRTHNRIERLVRESRLPLEKSLETFDRKRLPTKVSGLVSTLLEGDFLDRSENVLAFGNPGSGKRHLRGRAEHQDPVRVARVLTRLEQVFYRRRTIP